VAVTPSCWQHSIAGMMKQLGGCALLALVVCLSSGCYAPLKSYGIPASTLPDTFRMPCRTGAPPLNFASLVFPAPPEYVLGSNDVIEVTIHGMNPGGEAYTARCQVMGPGTIQLPIVGDVRVGGLNLTQAQMAMTKAYANGVLREPRVNVFLVEKRTTSVLVLGAVNTPGVFRLPHYENDVAHALALAGGLAENAGQEIEVHRRVAPPFGRRTEEIPPPGTATNYPGDLSPPTLLTRLPDTVEDPGAGLQILRIPLRGYPEQPLTPSDTVLQHGDVVVVPDRSDEVFFVVGKLSPINAVRFSLDREDRELGSGFVLPPDRDIDVVTAVCMAGYIDPIDSPTTVTLQRVGHDGRPLLIRVNLIKARYDRRETVLVAAGDIIYLNPDMAWWSRRTFDRIIPPLFSLSYRKLLGLGGGGSGDN